MANLPLQGSKTYIRKMVVAPNTTRADPRKMYIRLIYRYKTCNILLLQGSKTYLRKMVVIPD